jgi:hypothetical protein
MCVVYMYVDILSLTILFVSDYCIGHARFLYMNTGLLEWGYRAH